jgi:predicted porin
MRQWDGRLLKISSIVVGLMMANAGHAQSSITLYGNIDGGLLYTSKTLNSATGTNAGHQFSAIDSGLNSTDFGLMGTEDLGGGYKAKFKLESGISVMNGGFNDSNGNLFGRQAYVSLDTPYGVGAIGEQFSPFFLALYDTDARQMSEFGSGLIQYVGNLLVTGLFNSNALSYASPSIYGVRGSAFLALGGQAGDFQAGRQYSASLAYENGSLLLNAAVYSGNGGGTVQTPIPSTVEFWGRMVGATYKFGVVTAKAQFVNYKVAQGFNSNVIDGGLDWFVTPQFDLNGGVYFTSDRDHVQNHSVVGALGATYFISKRTSVYAQAGIVDNHGSMDTGLSINSALNGVQGKTIGADIGIQHTF